MTSLYNLKWGETRRRALRRRSTVSEKLFWERVRNRQIGYKVRRQFGVGYYILDFYIPQLNLGIEIDGEIHLRPEVARYDQMRERELRSLGIKLLRYTRASVMNNLDKVLTDLQSHALQESPSVTPLLPKERGQG